MQICIRKKTQGSGQRVDLKYPGTNRGDIECRFLVEAERSVVRRYGQNFGLGELMIG